MLWSGCGSAYDDAGCYLAAYLNQHVLQAVLDYTFDTALPATGDLQPGSPFLRNLNSTPEAFTRVGIQSFPARRWSIVRLGGDFRCDPESRCGGRAFVKYIKYSYRGFQACVVIASIYGYYDIAGTCYHIASSMNNLDATWNSLTAPYGDRTDGIVQGSSQYYPNAVKQYPISGGDSHVGETKSDRTRPRLEEALRVYFRAPLRG